MAAAGLIRYRGRQMQVDEVRVWVLRPDLASAGHLSAFGRVLNEEESARAGRFHFLEDQRSFICAHALTRCALADISGIAARDFDFRIERFGKPELETQPARGRLRFNLSHSRGLVCCAITQERDVGIDVERGARDLDLECLARQVLTEEELAVLAQLKGHVRRDAFLSIWTVKEAYIKAVGAGLSIPLNSFSVRLDPLSLVIGRSLRCDPTAGTDADWNIRLARPRAGYRSAVAVRTGAAGRAIYRFSEVVPDALAVLCCAPGKPGRTLLTTDDS